MSDHEEDDEQESTESQRGLAPETEGDPEVKSRIYCLIPFLLIDLSHAQEKTFYRRRGYVSSARSSERFQESP